MDVQTATSEVLLPRVTIKFCTQCKWMLRAAYVGFLTFLIPFYQIYLVGILRLSGLGIVSPRRSPRNPPSRSLTIPIRLFHLLHVKATCSELTVSSFSYSAFAKPPQTFTLVKLERCPKTLSTFPLSSMLLSSSAFGPYKARISYF